MGIHYGAQVDVTDQDGLTPLHMAAGYANAQTLRVLVTAGADEKLTGDNQGTAIEVVTALGEYQYSDWKEKQKKGSRLLKRFQKKDEKLEKLKLCMEVLQDVEKVRNDECWDQMLRDVLRTMA